MAVTTTTGGPLPTVTRLVGLLLDLVALLATVFAAIAAVAGPVRAAC